MRIFCVHLIALGLLASLVVGSAMEPWVVVTGGGSGIGRGLVHHFSRDHLVLTCGRRADKLRETKQGSARPEAVTTVVCDLGTTEGREMMLAAIPSSAPVRLLVQNAAIGDPAPLAEIDMAHFEKSLQVNVVAPLALTQGFRQRLLAGSGRILHLGTSVAHQPQKGTATYGVSKAAFHRLYQQLNAEDSGIPVGSLSPGLVDTEGVRDHVQKARKLDLPHVTFFDQAFEKDWTTAMADLLRLIDDLLTMNSEEFSAKEWRFSEWRKQCELKQSGANDHSSL